MGTTEKLPEIIHGQLLPPSAVYCLLSNEVVFDPTWKSIATACVGLQNHIDVHEVSPVNGNS